MKDASGVFLTGLQEDVDHNEFDMAPGLGFLPSNMLILLFAMRCVMFTNMGELSDISFMDLKDTAYNMSVHIMSQGYEYDLKNRKPIIPDIDIKSSDEIN